MILPPSHTARTRSVESANSTAPGCDESVGDPLRRAAFSSCRRTSRVGDLKGWRDQQTEKRRGQMGDGGLR